MKRICRTCGVEKELDKFFTGKGDCKICYSIKQGVKDIGKMQRLDTSSIRCERGQKACATCRRPLPINSFYPHRNSCKRCVSIKSIERSKLGKYRAYRRNWKRVNKERVNASTRRIHKKSCDELREYYVVAMMSNTSGLPKSIIRQYPELIEVQTLIIKTKRLCKTLQN